MQAINFPVLYKKTHTGAIQFWELKTEDNSIITIYGQLNTANPQETRDVIKEGKNIGKKTETTPTTQAQAEAKSRWEKQQKRGYVLTIEAAEKGEESDLIEGGLKPMLAEKFTEKADKVVYPAYCQPKLDGHRCIAIIENGKATLWTRQRKPITSVPHIIKELERLFEGYDHLVLDGELYNHGLKAEFERLSSAIRKKEPSAGSELIQYHVYDVVMEKDFYERKMIVFQLLGTLTPAGFYEQQSPIIVPVETQLIDNEEQVTYLFTYFTEQGYEGCMIRNSKGHYEHRRSNNLQKVKEFEDDEFKIIGVEEGRGKLQGHAAVFVCLTKDGKTFQAKMKGSTSELKRYWDDHSLWLGRMLTVKYQGFTTHGIPRFPVGLRFYEGL